MYLLVKLGGHRSCGNGNIDSYINSYMYTSAKAELTASIHHLERFSKSGIPIYISEVPETAGRKTTTTTITTILTIPQVIAKRYAFHAKAIMQIKNSIVLLQSSKRIRFVML